MDARTDPAKTFHQRDLSGASFREVDLTGVTMRGVWMSGTVIEGDIEDLVINGVEVLPLIEAELDRRDPERALIRAQTADDMRTAWVMLEGRWAATVDRARTLQPDLLHESVDGEWSFVQTLRHLAFATDCWIIRALLGEPRPWHALSLPWDTMDPHPDVPWDRDARISLDEALELRSSRQAVVRDVLADLTDERLAEQTVPVEGPGWPPPESFGVGKVLRVVLNEEWHHRLYAERDLDVLTTRSR